MSRLVLRADAYQGVTKGRWALLELGRKRPDVIDSGVVAWNEEQYGPDEGRVKMRLSFKAQVQAAAGCRVPGQAISGLQACVCVVHSQPHHPSCSVSSVAEPTDAGCLPGSQGWHCEPTHCHLTLPQGLAAGYSAPVVLQVTRHSAWTLHRAVLM